MVLIKGELGLLPFMSFTTTELKFLILALTLFLRLMALAIKLMVSSELIEKGISSNRP